MPRGLALAKRTELCFVAPNIPPHFFGIGVLAQNLTKLTRGNGIDVIPPCGPGDFAFCCAKPVARNAQARDTITNSSISSLPVQLSVKPLNDSDRPLLALRRPGENRNLRMRHSIREQVFGRQLRTDRWFKRV